MKLSSSTNSTSTLVSGVPGSFVNLFEPERDLLEAEVPLLAAGVLVDVFLAETMIKLSGSRSEYD
jgi:hypothetical protein